MDGRGTKREYALKNAERSTTHSRFRSETQTRTIEETFAHRGRNGRPVYRFSKSEGKSVFVKKGQASIPTKSALKAMLPCGRLGYQNGRVRQYFILRQSKFHGFSI